MKEEIKVQLFRFLNKEVSKEGFQQWTYLFCDELEKEAAEEKAKTEAESEKSIFNQ